MVQRDDSQITTAVGATAHVFMGVFQSGRESTEILDLLAPHRLDTVYMLAWLCPLHIKMANAYLLSSIRNVQFSVSFPLMHFLNICRVDLPRVPNWSS